MSELMTLGDVADVVAGVGFPKEMQGRQDGAIPVFKVGDISAAWLQGKNFLTESRNYLSQVDAKSLGRLIPAGATVFAKIGEALRLNRRVMLGCAALVDNNVMGLVPDKAKVSPKYLYYFMQTVDLGDLSRSTTVPSIRKSDVLDIPINVPELAEQDEIVAELEMQFTRLDKAVANLQRVKANLKRYKASILKAAVEGRLVETEGGWRRSNLGEEASIIGGLTKNQKRNNLPLKLPYLRVANVYANELRLDDIEYIGVAEKELEKLLVRKGDLLVVEGNGSPDQIGRVALWNAAIPKCVHQNHLIKVRLSDDVLPQWALAWMLSPVGRYEIEQVSASTSGLHTLSVGKVSRLPIGVPSLEEQSRIVAEVDRQLSILRGVEIAVNANLRSVHTLRGAVLAKSFVTA